MESRASAFMFIFVDGVCLFLWCLVFVFGVCLLVFDRCCVLFVVRLLRGGWMGERTELYFDSEGSTYSS